MCRLCDEMKAVKPKEGDLRVWWIPQVPMQPFEIVVDSPKEAKKLLDILGKYDEFQFEHKIKPDYSNAGGLVIYDLNSDGEGNPGWCDWMDENGNDIDDTESL